MLRISALLAIVTGLLLAVGEIVVNWGDWQWWPWWLVDFVAAMLLVSGGILCLRRSTNAPIILGIGWAFTAGMVWMSLASNVADGVDTGRDARAFGSYVVLLSALLLTAATGLALTLLGARDQPKL